MPILTSALSNQKLLALALLISLCIRCIPTGKNNSAREGTNARPHSIWTTEWSADGQYIAVGGDDSTLWIYKAGDYDLYKTYKSNSPVKGLSWHPRENLLAIANSRGIQMLDLNTEQLFTVPGLRTGGRGIKWNRTGELLALADGAGFVQVLTKQGKLLRSIPKYNNHSYMSVDWHPHKDIIVTASDEIILFDTSGRQLNLFRHRKEHVGLLTVRWHPSGEFFATGDYGHENEGMPTVLQFWKEDGTLIKEMYGSHAEYRNIRWNKAGTLLATASDALRIWDRQGKLLFTGASPQNLWGIAWSKDDKHIVTGSFGEGRVTLWDNKARKLKEIH